MLKEQLLHFAMKAISQVQETKERFKIRTVVKDYVKNIKEIALVIEEKFGPKLVRKTKVKSKKRKSSIKPVHEINSQAAEQILQMLKNNSCRLLDKADQIDGKKSLAYLLWALGHAERANIINGLSVHDVSALLYQACQIELYPINISRVVHSTTLVKKSEGHTKTYTLTPKGQNLFKKKFL
jgi:predicted transcriptional regulator